jgi:glutamine synthetase
MAPSQFELNYAFSEANIAADQIQLYKLVCRQIAHNMDMTACFLPKPRPELSGSGLHLNLSMNRKGKNLFYSPAGPEGLSTMAWDYIDRVLNNIQELCLIFNPSVNAYRRLDPKFEAPNQVKASAANRGALIRIPSAAEKWTRIELRSVSPDINPYLAIYTLLRMGLEGAPEVSDGDKRSRTRFLPDTISDALRLFKTSRFAAEILGDQVFTRYADIKQACADRCPRELGKLVKPCEVQFHHEVTNQYLWNQF